MAPIPLSPDRCFVIAEAGTNHAGRLDLAFKLIEAAKAAGADAVKFQFHRREWLDPSDYDDVTWAKLEEYALYNLAAGEERIATNRLKARCEQVSITFLCTPFHPDAVGILAPLPAWKIRARDYAFGQTLRAVVVADSKSPILQSIPADRWSDRLGVHFGTRLPNLVDLYCNDDRRPCPPAEIHLPRNLAGCGFSDHATVSANDRLRPDGTDPWLITGALAAARGALVVERHLMLCWQEYERHGVDWLFLPDFDVSLMPHAFDAYVRHIRFVETTTTGQPSKERGRQGSSGSNSTAALTDCSLAGGESNACRPESHPSPPTG